MRAAPWASLNRYFTPVRNSIGASSEGRRAIGDYARESIPFLIAVSIAALLLIFLPGVVLIVPNLLFGTY